MAAAATEAQAVRLLIDFLRASTYGGPHDRHSAGQRGCRPRWCLRPPRARGVAGSAATARGATASRAGLQRDANTNRVSNDGVSGDGRSLDDLTAGLASESKTLLQVIDRQAHYPDGWDPLVVTARLADCGRRHTVGSPHDEFSVDVGRGCRPSDDLFVELARRRDVRNHEREPADTTNRFRFVCGLRVAANDGDQAERSTSRVDENGPLTSTILASAVHELAAAESEGARDAGTNVENLEMWHPLQGEGLMFSGACPQADNRCAVVVRQIVTPQGSAPSGEDPRVEAEFPIMLRHRNICAEDSTDTADKWISHDHRIQFEWARTLAGPLHNHNPVALTRTPTGDASRVEVAMERSLVPPGTAQKSSELVVSGPRAGRTEKAHDACQLARGRGGAATIEVRRVGRWSPSLSLLAGSVAVDGATATTGPAAAGIHRGSDQRQCAEVSAVVQSGAGSGDRRVTWASLEGGTKVAARLRVEPACGSHRSFDSGLRPSLRMTLTGGYESPRFLS